MICLSITVLHHLWISVLEYITTYTVLYVCKAETTQKHSPEEGYYVSHFQVDTSDIYIYMIDSDKQTKLFNQNGIMYCMLVKIQRNWFWFKGLFFGLIIAQIFNNIVYICRRFLKMHNDFDHISSLIIGESNLIFCFVLLFYIKKLRVSQQYFYLIFVFI